MVGDKAAEAYVRLLESRSSRFSEVEPAVKKIVEEVRREGDQALVKYARKLDGLEAKQGLRVSEGEMRKALQAASPKLRSALRAAEKNIRRFCEWQNQKGGLVLLAALRWASWLDRWTRLVAT